MKPSADFHRTPPNIAHYYIPPPRRAHRDAAYRGPLYRGLSDGNATKYLTLEKDLGGFNNIRMSLECAVAIAAAMGRTFVIPPPFSIWGMNTGDGKMVRISLFIFLSGRRVLR